MTEAGRDCEGRPPHGRMRFGRVEGGVSSAECILLSSSPSGLVTFSHAVAVYHEVIRRPGFVHVVLPLSMLR